MSDALGGVVNIGMVVFFLTVIALYMAYNVNYQKAFNVKNEIIARWEEYNGKCDSECRTKINEYESKLGYKNIPLTEGNGYRCKSERGYCVKGVASKTNSDNTSVNNGNIKYCYFSVVTLVYIDIPFINHFLNLKVFQVTGQTKAMKMINTGSCDQLAQSYG